MARSTSCDIKSSPISRPDGHTYESNSKVFVTRDDVVTPIVCQSFVVVTYSQNAIMTTFPFVNE